MFIVLEGLDGAGKSTQIRLLRRLLAERGVESEYVHFPRFDAPVYGELIARFLRGEFGGVGQVDPYLVALLFAGDRADFAPQIRQWLAGGRPSYWTVTSIRMSATSVRNCPPVSSATG